VSIGKTEHSDDAMTGSKMDDLADTNVVTDSKTDGPIDKDGLVEEAAVDDVVSDCDTTGSGVLVIAEARQADDHESTDDAAVTDKTDICAVDDSTSQNGGSADMPAPTDGAISNALSGADNDQSATPKSENAEINTAKKSSAENDALADDITKDQVDNVTSPAARSEVIR